MPGGNHHHRAGSLRQTNKGHKSSKASKRSLAKAAGGKLAGGGRKTTAQHLQQQSKANRRHHQQQQRQKKRDEILKRRRGLDGTSPVPPRIIAVVSLGTKTEGGVDLEQRLVQFVRQDADQTITPHVTTTTTTSSTEPSADAAATVTCKYNVHKKDGSLTFLTAGHAFPGQDPVLAALDVARVADVVIFLLDGNASPDSAAGSNNNNEDPILDMQIGKDTDDAQSCATGRTTRATTSVQGRQWDFLISARGDAILSALKAQGMPTVLTVLAHTPPSLDAAEVNDQATVHSVKSLRRAAVKRHLELKKYVHRFATTEFGASQDKVLEVDLASTFVSSETTMTDDPPTTTTPPAVTPPPADAAGDMDTEDTASHSRSVTAASATSSSTLVRTTPAMLIRTLCHMSASPSKWISESPRTYLLSDSYRYDVATQELSVTGYLRGKAPWDVHALVHLPRVGTFRPSSVTRLPAPFSRLYRGKGGAPSSSSLAQSVLQRLGGGSNSDNTTTGDGNLVLQADPAQQEPLERFALPNSLDGEQNLVGFDEEDGLEEKSTTKDPDEDFARPAGWSDYQAAWLDAVDDLPEDDADVDRGELAKELNRKKTETASVGPAPGEMMDLDEANFVSQQERETLLEQRRKEQTEHTEFPDEVQIGEDDSATDRFARYRSLKSFRKSYWDPKENLPESYATIYHFSSFRATQRTIMNDRKESMRAAKAARGHFFGQSPGTEDGDITMEDEDDYDPLEGCIPSGAYVTLTLANVDKDAMEPILSSNSLLTAVSLLEHENKVSVLHMGLSQSTRMAQTSDEDGESAVPIKSKDVLTFRCGWRTWKARPVFSQNNLNCDKHKFERFMPTGGAFFAASIFGPVTYTPCPVLVWRESLDENTGVKRNELVAAGSMLSADADRIVVKRIILTGFPVRVHKRHATVKYMFYNPDDVRFFKPAGLYTKHGLHGHIMESVGEHGTMKCLFNAPIKQHDTVCLPLYKRVYPKYAPPPGQSPDDKRTVAPSASTLVVT